MKKTGIWLRGGALAALAVAAAWVFVRFLLGPLMPFLLALALARLMERPVRLLSARLRLPRAVSAGLLTVTAVGLIIALGAALLGVLWNELNRLVAFLPDLISRLPDITGGWRARVDIWIAAAPLSMQEMLRGGVESVLGRGARFPEAVYERAGAWVAALAAGLPKAALFFVTLILSTFLMSCEYGRLTAWLLKPFPESVRERILKIKDHMAGTCGKWLKAQGILILLTFSALFVGLTAMRVEYAFLLAGVTALLDALPVIGVAVVLLPWALYSLMTGAVARGVGLLLLYAAVTLLRGFLEPKLVGRRIGLPPLPTLMSLYIGFLLWGVPGMILTPFAVVMVKQMAEWGWIWPGRTDTPQHGQTGQGDGL